MKLTTHQVATAAAADRKWLMNSAAILRRPLRHTVGEAKWWGLVRHLSEALELSLTTAAKLATEALAAATDTVSVRPDPTESIALEIDLRRYTSIFIANLSRALVHETPKRRGRVAPRATGLKAIRAARHYGVDIGLVHSALERTPAERLAMAEANAQFVRGMQGGRR